jgi:hypothetical protein
VSTLNAQRLMSTVNSLKNEPPGGPRMDPGSSLCSNHGIPTSFDHQHISIKLHILSIGSKRYAQELCAPFHPRNTKRRSCCAAAFGSMFDSSSTGPAQAGISVPVSGTGHHLSPRRASNVCQRRRSRAPALPSVGLILDSLSADRSGSACFTLGSGTVGCNCTPRIFL